jgi:hypothetical protein
VIPGFGGTVIRPDTDGLIDALIGRAALLRSPVSQVELLAPGGAIARVEADATAFEPAAAPA